MISPICTPICKHFKKILTTSRGNFGLFESFCINKTLEIFLILFYQKYLRENLKSQIGNFEMYGVGKELPRFFVLSFLMKVDLWGFMNQCAAFVAF